MLASLNFVEKFISLPKKNIEIFVNGKQITKAVFDTTHVAQILTRQGFEVENIRQFGGGFDSIVVGRIERFERHSEANRLNVCFVNVNEKAGELRQIVCGGRNVRAGMYVAVALPGTKLPVVSKLDPAVKPRDDTSALSSRGLTAGSSHENDALTFEIKSSVIRNVKSDGMLCARGELGLSVNADVDIEGGIWDIADDAQGGAQEAHLAKNLGKPVFMTLGLEDTLLELSVTPNRPDVLCQRGVARELAAGFSYNQISYETKSFDFASSSPVSANVILNDVSRNSQGVCAGITFEACNYIQANAFFVLIELTKEQNKTPGWLRNLLEPLNQNSINLIVDISNFILVAYAQPNHTFDLDGIDADNTTHKKLVLRHAHANELFMGLDGKERTLHEADCVVSDSSIPQALLGVVGGAYSKIKNNTRRIVVEFANPNPTAIRHTARRHSKHTVASFMFEKGIDVDARFHAAAEFTALLSHLTQHGIKYCTSVHSKNLENNPVAQTAFQKTLLPLHVDDQKKILGTDLITFSTQLEILNALGFETLENAAPGTEAWTRREERRVHDAVGGTQATQQRSTSLSTSLSTECLVGVPTWRANDVVGTADLVEEFIRVAGIDHVPPVPIDIAATVNKDDTHLSAIEKVCTNLCALGYNEVAGLNFMRADDYQKLNFSSPEALGTPVALLNPVLGDEPLLQTTLIPDLLRKVERNINYGIKAGQIFYSARTFQKVDGEDRPSETHKIAGVCFGQKTPKNWQNSAPQPWSLHDIMMHVASVARVLDVKIEFRHLSQSPFAAALHPKKQVEFFSGDETSSILIGWLGELHPKVKRSYGIDNTDIYLFEINLDELMGAYLFSNQVTKKSFAVPRFPLLSRDFSFILPSDVTAKTIEHCVQTALTDVFANSLFAALKSLQIFDLYRGEGMPENKKSVTFKVVVEPQQKTFTEHDIQILSSCVVDAVSRQLGGEQRI